MSSSSSLKYSKPRIGWSLRFALAIGTITCAAYASALIRPNEFWPAGVVAMSIPFWLLVNVVLLCWFLFKRPFNALVPAAVLALGFSFIQASFQLRPAQTPVNEDLKVISYNAQTFRGYSLKIDGLNIGAEKQLAWLNQQQADVLCIQEFFYQPKHPSLDIKQRITKMGYPFYYYSSSMDKGKWGNIGLMIFSKHPILRGDSIYKREGSNNQVITVDIAYKGQTIRIYNLHLQSVHLVEEDLNLAFDDKVPTQGQVKTVLKKLRNAFWKRGGQIDMLMADMANCPHPIILCGDFNDTPYGNTYQKLRRKYQNAFEKKGSGFGFTHNGTIPFLRIDNQFASPSLHITGFHTDTQLIYSDHFPIIASYALEKPK